MDTGRISARYAKALYEYAAERKKEKEVYEEMKLISDVFFLVPELTKALDNPRISSEKKKELLMTAAGSSDAPPEFVRFLDLIIERKRESYLHLMSLVYQDIYRKMKGIVIGKLTTAQSVESKQEERMKKLVAEKTGGDVDFISNTNPDLIGGFVLQIGTYQLDASLCNQLKKIKDSLLLKNSVG